MIAFLFEHWRVPERVVLFHPGTCGIVGEFDARITPQKFNLAEVGDLLASPLELPL